MALRPGFGAEETGQVRAERPAGRPRLLAVEEPPAALGARRPATGPAAAAESARPALDALRSARECRQVGAGAGLRPALAPEIDACWSGVPNWKMAGARRKIPFCVTRCGAPDR